MYIWISSFNSIEVSSIEEAIKVIKNNKNAYSITRNGTSKSTNDFLTDLNFKG